MPISEKRYIIMGYKIFHCKDVKSILDYPGAKESEFFCIVFLIN